MPGQTLYTMDIPAGILQMTRFADHGRGQGSALSERWYAHVVLPQAIRREQWAG
jgi:hypothetical protein